MKALMCVPNISEGTDLDLVEKVVDTIRNAPGVMLLDYSSNSDHNRSVITYIGGPEAVVSATKNLTKTALGLIDMTSQKGSHPRQGAVDVVPFIPIRGISEEEAVSLAATLIRPAVAVSWTHVTAVHDQLLSIRAAERDDHLTIDVGPHAHVMKEAPMAMVGVSTIGPKLDERVRSLNRSGSELSTRFSVW